MFGAWVKLVLTSSTPFGVSAGRFASFRVVKFGLSAAHRAFCAGFDFRQLHQRKLVKAKSLGRLSFSSKCHQPRR
jgi:hypothetical protein